jgi:hypothetical protein
MTCGSCGAKGDDREATFHNEAAHGILPDL